MGLIDFKFAKAAKPKRQGTQSDPGVDQIRFIQSDFQG